MIAPSHEKISPTAKFVAYLRTFTDIPYSAEIAEACKAREAFQEIVGENPQGFLWTAPIVEMRYKSVDEALRRHFSSSRNSPNILELACGLSPRGLIWSTTASVTYLETDLPDILAEKTQIAMNILGSESRKNLQWLPLNVVNEADFLTAERFFPDGPVAVLNEGLLPYLNQEEKQRVVQNVHCLLKKRGGVWITPDISSNDRIKELIALDPNISRVLQAISGRTGRNLQSNSLGSMKEAEEFFMNAGFNVTQYDQPDLVPCLSSLVKIEVDPSKLEVVKKRGKLWVMEVRS